MPQRLSRFYAHLQRVEDERKIGEILREGGEVESEPGRRYAGRPTVTTAIGVVGCR